MVQLMIVSHSAQLAAGVREFVSQAAGELVTIAAVGGTPDGRLGMDFDRIVTTLQTLLNPDGVLVLIDMGSAAMTVQMALEVLPAANVIISNAPLVEGAYLAASEAAAGGTLAEVAQAAREAVNLPKLTDEENRG